MRIAIDGPVASGKDTVAKGVAGELGFVYIDSGALFRAVALFCLSSKVSVEDETVVCPYLSKVSPQIELRTPSQNENDGRFATTLLDGKDVTWDIRTPDVDSATSTVSKHKCVRDFLLVIQRKLAQSNDAIMSGRDIGTYVWPDAEVKVFLTAAEDVRANRRYKELLSRGANVSLPQVKDDIHRRDLEDSTRPLRPLKRAADAVEVDTSDMTIEEVVAKIVSLAKAIKNRSRIKCGMTRKKVLK